MENLFNPQDREGVMRRLSILQPSNPRQWGTMNPGQMLAHCAAALEVACGDVVKPQAFIGRVLAPFVKKSVLGEKPFSRNSPTDPDFKIAGDRDFAVERTRVVDLVEKMTRQGISTVDGRVHSFFGRLTGDEWGRLMIKHLDHHLRQFGRLMTDYDELMAEALVEARRGEQAGEVPIGAVVCLDGTIVGRGFNRPISAGDPTAHAEVVAIRDAASRVKNYRLTGAVLCVTVEPCLMCVGALVHARIGTLVYGASEPRTGAVTSTVQGLELPGHNHRVAVVSGVREDECRALMQAFFKSRRSSSSAGP